MSEGEGGMVWGEDGRPHPAPTGEEGEDGMVWGEDGRPHPPPTVEPADDIEGGG